MKAAARGLSASESSCCMMHLSGPQHVEMLMPAPRLPPQGAAEIAMLRQHGLGGGRDGMAACGTGRSRRLMMMSKAVQVYV